MRNGHNTVTGRSSSLNRMVKRSAQKPRDVTLSALHFLLRDRKEARPPPPRKSPISSWTPWTWGCDNATPKVARPAPTTLSITRTWGRNPSPVTVAAKRDWGPTSDLEWDPTIALANRSRTLQQPENLVRGFHFGLPHEIQEKLILHEVMSIDQAILRPDSVTFWALRKPDRESSPFHTFKKRLPASWTFH